MTRWFAAALLGALLATAPALADDDPRLRVTGTTLQDFEQQLFGQQGSQQEGQQAGLAQGTTPFEARFRDVSLSQADQQKLLNDLQKVSKTLPADSRVRVQGTIDGRAFKAEVRNHEGELRIELRGVRFASQQDARNFVNSLKTAGAERIRVRGVLENGQRFDARFRMHNGRVEQRFRVKNPEHEHHGTLITSASGRSQVEGARPKPEVEAEHGRKYDGDHGKKYGDDSGKKYGDDYRPKNSGDQGSKYVEGRSYRGSEKSFSSAGSSGSGRSGHGNRGKD